MSMTEDLTARLEACYSAVIHDVLREMGQSDFTLPPRLRPLMPERKMAGPAFTVRGKAGEFDHHETLLAWTGLLSQCPEGHVWVNQPNDDVVAHMGELSAETLQDKGVRGCVLDGMARDTDFLLDIGFQCWFSGYTPRDIVGTWLPEAVGEEIRIGPVDIAPGDWMMGDRDGLVRIPAAMVEEVVDRAEKAATEENAIRTAIRGGMDPRQAYIQHGRF